MSRSQTDKMLQAAEEIVGRYIWGQYDLLVMPPSFPYGGMENPCLTFVSPTLLVSKYCHTIMTRVGHVATFQGNELVSILSFIGW